MFCKACGNELINTAVICPKCGSAVSNDMETVPNLKTLLIWGWITAIVVPIVGIVIGIVALVKRSYGHGVGIIVTSLFSWMVWAGFWMALFSSL